MASKIYPDAAAALDGLLFDGMTIAAGGFGLCGIPERLIDAIVASGSSAMPPPVAGLMTVKWSRSSPARQLPSMNNLRSASYPMTRQIGAP